MTLKYLYPLLIASGLCLSTVACAGNKSDDEKGDGDGDGSTTCGPSTCEAGQHCNNAICVNGCLTAENCSSNQICEDIDSDTKIGTCRDKSTDPTPAEKDCDTFCDKALACGDPDWVICEDMCVGSSSACVACVNDSNCGAGCEEICGL